jgi:hypothetical protein
VRVEPARERTANSAVAEQLALKARVSFDAWLRSGATSATERLSRERRARLDGIKHVPAAP